MKYLYHRVPKGFTGNILYPLNQLKHIFPDLYEAHIKKYEGREQLMKEKIPLLDCLWNDVLHVSAVEPKDVRMHLEEAGFNYRPDQYFKIPIERVLGKDTVALLFHKSSTNAPHTEDYEMFDPNKMEVYATFPNAALEYYKKCKKEERHPLLYNLVPHILYKGAIDTTGLEIITV